MELANEPQIKPRLSTGAVQVFACDLTLGKFPPKETLDSLGIKSFQQDATQPFPGDLHGTFDLAHIALFTFVMTAEGWAKVLKNVYQLLSTDHRSRTIQVLFANPIRTEPGGYVVIVEADPVAYTDDNPPPPAGTEHDFDARLDDKTAAGLWTKLFLGFSLKSNFVAG